MDGALIDESRLGDTDMHSAVVHAFGPDNTLSFDTSGGRLRRAWSASPRPATKQTYSVVGASRAYAVVTPPHGIEVLPHVPAGDARDSVVEVAITAEASSVVGAWAPARA
jgi:hypothetical protein